MPSTKRIQPAQVARQADRDRLTLEALVNGLNGEEYGRYRLLLREAGYSRNVTDRLAILDRARAHVAAADLAEREKNKAAEEHRDQLFGG